MPTTCQYLYTFFQTRTLPVSSSEFTSGIEKLEEHEKQSIVDAFSLISVDAYIGLEGTTKHVERLGPSRTTKLVGSYVISSDSESDADQIDDEALEKEIEKEASQDHLAQELAREVLPGGALHDALRVYDISDYSGNCGQQFRSQGIY